MDPSHPPGGVMVHGTFPWHIFGPLRIKRLPECGCWLCKSFLPQFSHPLFGCGAIGESHQDKSAESLPSNHWNMECATKNWGSSESKRTSKLVYVIKWPKCCRGVSWLRNAKSSKPCLVLTGWITCIHHMQGCRHQPAELDLCDFLQNEKENKAYSDKYANLNFKAFIKIIMKTKIQSRWEEPKEKEEKKKKVSLLYNIHLPKFEHKHLLRWCDRFTAATTLNLNCCSYNGFSESGYHYIIVFITIIVIFHHFVFAQKKKKRNKKTKQIIHFSGVDHPLPTPQKTHHYSYSSLKTHLNQCKLQQCKTK